MIGDDESEAGNCKMKTGADKMGMLLALALAAWTVKAGEDPEVFRSSADLAAEEISNYVAKATGCAPAFALRIGTREAFPGEVPAAAKAALDKLEDLFYEAAWTSFDGKTLTIVGKEQPGDLYAAYRFLEQKVGVRWFKAWTPEDPGEYVPQLAKLDIEPYEETVAPALTVRQLGQTAANSGIAPTNGATCAIRNGLQVAASQRPWSRLGAWGIRGFLAPRISPRKRNNGGGHDIGPSVVPAEKYFKDHPEYFPLIEGKRVPDSQFCMSNPDVIRLVADHYVRMHEADGCLGTCQFAMADTASGYCTCANCRAWDGPSGERNGIATRFHRFAAEVRKACRAKCPGIRFNFSAYSIYRNLPEGFDPDPTDILEYCTHECCYGHTFDDPACPRNAIRFKEAKAWLAKCPELFLRGYFTCTGVPYSCYERQQVRDLRAYRKAGFAGWFEEALFYDAKYWPPYDKKPGVHEMFRSVWQWLYVAGHASWNPELDPDELLADAESKYYGPAYAAMKPYHALRRELWDSNTCCFGYPTGNQRTPVLLSVGDAKEKLLGYLAEAEKLSAGDKILSARVAFDRHCLEEYWVKPNDEYKARQGRQLRAPLAKSPVVIDGSGDEPAWKDAFYTDDFQGARTYERKGGEPLPPELATRVGILCDAKSLYFLVTAKEPATDRLKLTDEKDGPVWGDDAIEFFIRPPSIDNCYAHIAVNALGTVYDARCPGMDSAYDYGVEAKGRRERDRYVLEVRVPAAKLHPIRAGETWQILVGRNRRVKDPLSSKYGWTLGASRHHDPLSFFSTAIGGSNCVRNGSFERLDEKGFAWKWGSRVRTAETEGGRCLDLSGSDATLGVFMSPLDHGPTRRKFTYAFRARGTGSVGVCFRRFTDTPNRAAKEGYDRKFHPTKEGGTYAVSDAWQPFSGEGWVEPNETTCLTFVPDGRGAHVQVDDVSVLPAE
mgnify:CR=1 FL=1